MQENELRRVLGAELDPSRVIDTKIEEAYRSIRNGEVRRTGGKSLAAQRILVGIGSVAAVLVLMVTFCVMNPVMASGIPVLGGIFEKLSDWFPFGRLPEEGTMELYQENADVFSGKTGQNNEGNGEIGAQGAQDASAYQQASGDITITLTEEYATNQAVYIGVNVRNAQGFPNMAVFENGTGSMSVQTEERYSFRQDVVHSWRQIEGRFTDAYTFEGILRIDYSAINKDSTKYEQASKEAEANGEELSLTVENYAQYIEEYEIPETFTMKLEFSNIVGELALHLPVEGAKPGEEQERMTDEEWEAYMKSLPREYYQYPNKYEHWWQEGSWSYDLTITQKDKGCRVIEVNQTNESGIGLRNIELSSVEMTLNTIESADIITIAVALDADGNMIENGSTNAYELAIAGHDISKVYIYICDYYEYMDEIRGYRFSENNLGRSFQEVLEERALFKTVVETGE